MAAFLRAQLLKPRGLLQRSSLGSRSSQYINQQYTPYRLDICLLHATIAQMEVHSRIAAEAEVLKSMPATPIPAGGFAALDPHAAAAGQPMQHGAVELAALQRQHQQREQELKTQLVAAQKQICELRSADAMRKGQLKAAARQKVPAILQDEQRPLTGAARRDCSPAGDRSSTGITSTPTAGCKPQNKNSGTNCCAACDPNATDPACTGGCVRLPKCRVCSDRTVK